MDTKEKQIPQTLQQAIQYFSDPQVCHDYMVGLRWPNTVCCPRCGSIEIGFVKTRFIWNCWGCKKQFSVKVGTVLEDSPLKLSTWLPCFWLIANAKNGISSCEIARSLGVTQKTAWFMLHRIRYVMQVGTIEKMSGPCEADETAIGGLEKNKHQDKRRPNQQGMTGKTIVMGILERTTERGPSKVKAKIVPNATGKTLQAEIKETVKQFSAVYTDAWKGYRGLSADYIHDFVDHAVMYAIGQVHTNGLENFWALLKRCLKGTYVSVEPFHLKAYIDEQVFRFNNRKLTDAQRFELAIGNVSGKRLTYEVLTSAYEAYFGEAIA